MSTNAPTDHLGVGIADRVLGNVGKTSGGPTLLCIAGIHGNEPAGVHAVRRVLDPLAQREDRMLGRFVAFAGNVAALAEGRRFVDRDLNRAWTLERIAELRSGESGVPSAAEDREQVELLAQIESVLGEARGPVFALDLHTTSGPGGVFSAFTDALPHRSFARLFPVPMIFGLEELVDGTLLNLLSEHGVVALTVETGQHDEAESVDRAEAALWIALVAAGILSEDDVPELRDARSRLTQDTRGLPRALEMRYKRDVTEEDGFVMKPGYSNFQRVQPGEVVAADRGGPVSLDEGGRLLMPLYQEQGEDGFFLVREFSAFWMAVSSAMRSARLSAVAHWLPGVRRRPDRPNEVVVDRRIARYFARQLFHLLGYRQIEDQGATLVMRRRDFDEGRYRREPPVPTPIGPR